MLLKPVRNFVCNYIGVKATAAEIKKGFKKAFSEPWPERLRYEVSGACLSTRLTLVCFSVWLVSEEYIGGDTSNCLFWWAGAKHVY